MDEGESKRYKKPVSVADEIRRTYAIEEAIEADQIVIIATKNGGLACYVRKA